MPMLLFRISNAHDLLMLKLTIIFLYQFILQLFSQLIVWTIKHQRTVKSAHHNDLVQDDVTRQCETWNHKPLIVWHFCLKSEVK